MSYETYSPTRGPGRPCSAEDDDYKVQYTHAVLGLEETQRREKEAMQREARERAARQEGGLHGK